MATNGGPHHGIKPLLHSWNPGRTVPDLRRAAFAGTMALDALRLHDLLAAALTDEDVAVDLDAVFDPGAYLTHTGEVFARLEALR